MQFHLFFVSKLLIKVFSIHKIFAWLPPVTGLSNQLKNEGINIDHTIF